MERRRSKRKVVHLEVEIISADKSYSGYIENISQSGIYVDTPSVDPLNTSTRFTPGNEFELKFKAPSGVEIRIECRVVWSFKTAPQGLSKKLGLTIINPSEKYLEFYKNQ